MNELSIEERNAAFHKLSHKEQRIAIAKDVLEQVAAGNYDSKMGVYFYVDFHTEAYDMVGTNVQDVLLHKNPKCEVCAVGAVFASAARLGNNLFYKKRSESKVAIDLFGYDSFLMENAFEGWSTKPYSTYLFYMKYPDPTDRLVAIFQNIIDNDGEFIP